MTAKQFLQEVRQMDRRIDARQERLDRIRARLEAGRMSSVTGMPRGGRSDWADTADRLIDLEQRVNSTIREMCRWKRLAQAAIDRIDDSRLRDVLEYYYIDGMTWEQVAEAMGYSDPRFVFRLHGRALQAFVVPEAVRRNDE